MKIFKRVVRILAFVGIAFAIGGLILCCFHDDTLVIQRYALTSSKVSGKHKFVALSDLHHRSLEFPNGNLVDKIKTEEPEAIFIIGDFFDQYVKDLDAVYEFIDELKDYRVYYVNGNHECAANDLYVNLQKAIEPHYPNFKFLYDTVDPIPLGDNIYLSGLHDPSFDLKEEKNEDQSYNQIEESLKKMKLDNSQFNILLHHRPELVNIYGEYDFDLMIAGHSHGGQVNINGWTPFDIFGGTFLYSGGEYTYHDKKAREKHFYVSRGLGYSAMFPLRINCNPEILAITIN